MRFRTTPTQPRLQSSLARVRGTVDDRNGDGIDDRFAHVANGQPALIRLDKGADIHAMIEELRQDPAVLYAEPNYIVSAQATPDDPRFPELYGLDNGGQTGGTADADIDAVEAWDVSVGSSDIVVAVIDSGIDYDHEDLAANMWVNPREVPGNGVDEDGNGVIDDVHGFNALTRSGDPRDDQRHGTHCAGTIGAVGNNGVGVAGVNWDVQLMAIKFLDEFGFGTVADAVASIDYAIAQRDAGVNLRVLSASWGGGEFSQALLDAINAAGEAELLFVAAAGNSASDNDSEPFYPASHDAPNVVSVAATDQDDQLSFFSNFGAQSVDLGAPGVDILSTTPGDRYLLLSGTSMATPHVAGVAALVLSANTTLLVADIKDLLLRSGDPIASLEGVTVSGTRLNAASALDQVGAPVPHFRLGVTPPHIVVTQEETATYTLNVFSLGGFADDVALGVTVDPPIDAMVDVTPVVTAPGTGALAIATSAETPSGVYSLTITGQSGGSTTSRTVSLRVRAPGDPLFGIALSPPVQSVQQGELALVDVTIESLGLTGDVFLGMTSEPELPADHDFFPNPVLVPGASTLNLFTSCDAPPGSYTLNVTGTAGGQTVTTSARIDVVPFEPIPPFPFFSYDANGLTVEFTDLSGVAGCGSDIVQRAWDFGDGATSDEQFPVHIYAAVGEYTVTLTVTDEIGLSASVSETLTVTDSPFALSIDRVTRVRARQEFRVHLRWSGARSEELELHRNDAVIDILENDGRHRDVFRGDEASYRWSLCEQPALVCSNEVSVDFGPDVPDGQARITTSIEGERIIATVPVEDE